MAWTCSAICPAVRFSRKPISPVAQNEHPIAQPTCDDTHTVSRFALSSSSKSGISTASMWRPEGSLKRLLMVRSVAC